MDNDDLFEEYLDMKTEQILKALGVPVDTKNLLNLRYHIEEVFEDGYCACETEEED